MTRLLSLSPFLAKMEVVVGECDFVLVIIIFPDGLLNLSRAGVLWTEMVQIQLSHLGK